MRRYSLSIPNLKILHSVDYRNQLMRSLYTGMLNNRLQEIAQKPESPFLYAGAGYGSFIGRSVDAYYLSMGAKENQIEKSLEVVLTENERVTSVWLYCNRTGAREEGSSFRCMKKWQKNLIRLNPDSYADEFIRNYMDKECIPGILKEFEIVKAYLPEITLDEIKQCLE